jgi:hypothetical protein
MPYDPGYKGDELEVEKVKIDAAASIFMDLMGTFMFYIVGLINKDVEAGSQIKVKKTIGRGVKELIEPISLQPRGTSDEDVHWIFIDDKMQEWNPYDLGMQLKGSQQFCQSHSLRVAILWLEGKLPPKPPSMIKWSRPYDSYVALIDFFEKIVNKYDYELKHPPKEMDPKLNIATLIRDQWIYQKENELEHYAKAVKAHPKTLKGVIAVLKSDLAMRYVPQWGSI